MEFTKCSWGDIKYPSLHRITEYMVKEWHWITNIDINHMRIKTGRRTQVGVRLDHKYLVTIIRTTNWKLGVTYGSETPYRDLLHKF